MFAKTRLQPSRLVVAFALIAAFALVAVAPATRAAETDSAAVDGAVAWLEAQQLDNGAFAAFGGESDPGATADVVYALAAAGIDPAIVVSNSGSSPTDYLVENAPGVAQTPGLAAKVALALIAAGADPRDANGTDLIAAIEAGFNPATGFYGMGAFNHAYALLALAAADADVEPAAIDALLAAQIDDGSWSFTGEPLPGTGDSNTTALAIQALGALGTADDAVTSGIEYLRSLQDESGAIAYDASSAPDLAGDANSTAVAIQAFVAAGEDASGLIEALSTFQNPDGSFFWQPTTPDPSLLATAQAVPALLEAPLPLTSSAAQSSTTYDEALQPAQPLPDCTYYEITEHNVCGRFDRFWTERGGLMIFGYPMTEEFVDEGGMTVQYFERARFEWHQEFAGTPYEILLGRLGAEHIDDAQATR